MHIHKTTTIVRLYNMIPHTRLALTVVVLVVADAADVFGSIVVIALVVCTGVFVVAVVVPQGVADISAPPAIDDMRMHRPPVPGHIYNNTDHRAALQKHGI